VAALIEDVKPHSALSTEMVFHHIARLWKYGLLEARGVAAPAAAAGGETPSGRDVNAGHA
jgi:hypothetical protein